MNLPSNLFDDNFTVQTFLCQPDKTILGELMPYDYNGTFKFNSYSEISFTVDRTYIDIITGETKVHPCYDLIDSLRVIYIRGVGHFVIQDVDENVADNETKSVTAFSLEYATGQKYLENFYINTGEEGSVETIYHSQKYGVEYAIDDYYTVVTNVSASNFDPYERYYKKEYNDNDTYNYVEEQVLNSDDFGKYDRENDETTLYIKKYPNVRFYWPTCPELSLLHLVFDLIPEWNIGYVDKELWYQERTFSEDRTAVYDFLYNNAAETLDFVMVWDSINGVCNFYKTTEDGVTTNTYRQTYEYNPNYIYYADENGTELSSQPIESDVKKGKYFINVGQTIDTQWDTNVFISRENLASQLDVKFSTDDIKTKLKIVGSDDLDIRDVNLGQNYIINLDYYNTYDWFGDLHPRYNEYKKKLATNTEEYQKYISEWAGSYNKYSDFMNAVPVEPRVMLVGDVFEKLYCVYNSYKPAPTDWDDKLNKTYYMYDTNSNSNTYLKYIPADPQPTKDTYKQKKYYVQSGQTLTELVTTLQNKLVLYKVDQQDNGKRSAMEKTDDILLTLENKSSDSATIRIKYDVNVNKEMPDKSSYLVYRTVTNAKTGIINTESYELDEWVSGELTASKMGLDDSSLTSSNSWKIKSIGTLGAYLCLVRDETEEANLEDYGIRLLEEKQATYTKIFIAQTEGYMSQEGNQCVAQDDQPDGEVSEGTKWLDTDSEPLTLYKYQNGQWTKVEASNDDAISSDASNGANYERYIENYKKLQAVQSVLLKKKKIAQYMLNGFAENTMYLEEDDINTQTLRAAIMMHFTAENGDVIPTITNTDYSSIYKVMTFTIDTDTENEYAIYVSEGTPYISYANSQGVCLAKMNYLKEDSDMNNFFTEGELTRLSPFIREDEFSDQNFLLTGYESEEEQMYIKQELLKAGDEELKKICQPKLSFDATMANILAIPEFDPLRKQFQLGNFVTVQIREGQKYTQKARLLEVSINFDDVSDFSATFGNLISTKSQIDKHAELLQQAVSAGKSVAANQSSWQKAVDKSTKLDQALNDGLKDAALSIGSANGQSIVWDQYGIRGRKLKEGSTNEYEDKQFALINNKLVFTDDNWQTSRAVVGEFEIDINSNKQKMYGLLADAIVGGYLQGTEIYGGKLEIGGSGGTFIVHENGSVEIKTTDDNGNTIDWKTGITAVNDIDNAYKYSIELSYTESTIFSQPEDNVIITAIVKKLGEPITHNLPVSTDTNPTTFVWYRNGIKYKTVTLTNENKPNTTINTNVDSLTANQINITRADVDGNAFFSCEVNFDDTNL